ncbi:MAG TPA: TonB-dependent receptor [Candidatus Acidoferrum sp.]|nr:TonB-dependent receptor [Candidatus Acidoferrum sp.]
MKVVVIALLGLSFVLSARAQSGVEGAIEGTVIDPSGAVVAEALLKARNIHTSATFSADSNESGLFEFPVLPVGTYELTVNRTGFAPLIQKDLFVTVGARINLTLTLTLAAKAESLVVNGGTPIVETTRSQVSTTVDSRSITELPINGRNFNDFVLLTPGVTRDARTGMASFAGQRSMNSLLVDGTDDNQTFFGLPMGSVGENAPYQFSLGVVQEFQVNSNAYSAELGRAGAGVINVVTKSGTNELHGTAFWYYRDKSLNADDAVNKLNTRSKSPYHFNQFGAALGGPLRKDKLFFLVGYDGQRSTIQNSVFLNLPGSFTFSSDPVVAGFQQNALAYLTARSASWNRTFDQNVSFARLDWQMRPSHLLTGRWNRQRFTGTGQENSGPQNSFEHTGSSLVIRDSLSVSLTSALSSSRINVARFGYVGSDQPGSAYSPNPEANLFQDGELVLTLGRNPISPRENTIHGLEWADTLSFLRGRHSLKIGANALWDRIDFFTAVNFSGSYRFNSLESFGRSLAGAPQPAPGEFYTQAFSGTNMPGARVHPNFTEWAVFVQDEWRVAPRVTLNLGLRYDLQVMARPTVKNPSSALTAAGLDTSFVPTDKNNLAPRLGFAWTPLPTSRFLVRGGYGIFYAMTPSIMTARPFFQNGLAVVTKTFRSGTPGAAIIPAYPNTLCGPPDPSGLPPSCAAPAIAEGNPTLVFFSPRYVQPYTQQGNFGIEVETRRDTAVSVGYMWVKGSHLQRTRDVNLAAPTTPTNIGIAGTSTVPTYQKFTLPRPITGFDRIWLFESAASSTYHGLFLQANKRLVNNFQFLASYTLGKVIDDAPDHFTVNPGFDDFGQISDSSNPRADRGPGANDQRHRFVLSGIWILDYAQSLPRAAKAILGGWEMSGIFAAQSGHPYSGLVNSDLNNDGNSANDRTPGLGRDTFYLPATISLDSRVTRNVSLNERVKLQLFSEAFNVLNHTNVMGVRTTQFSLSRSPGVCSIAAVPCLVPQNAGLSAFGTPTATSGPRIIQLSAKFVF